MQKNLAQFFLITGLFVSLFFPMPGQAQELISLYSAEDIFAETEPRVPKANQEVTMKLNSYSFNLNNYLIAWFEDGQKAVSGYGQREYSFTTKGVGELTEITAVVEYENQVFRKEFRFAPSEADILWEVTDAYTPPFYKGKALPIEQSRIRVVAIPETRLIEPNDAPNLVYYWDRNYDRQVSASGFGRSSYEFDLDPLNPEELIAVTINDRRENSTATNRINLEVNNARAKTLFYEINDNNRVLTNRALNNNGLIEKEELYLSFHPLFMSSTEANFVDLFVDWQINNQSQPPHNFAKQNELRVSSQGQTGSSTVRVSLEHIQKLLQSHTEDLSLVFSNSN